MSSKKKVSIIIPTRGKTNTLDVTLQTAINQSNKYDFEVIVSDNSDRDNNYVKKTFESLKCNNLVYSKTPNILSMCDSWEYALEKSNGEIVFFVGDDDGVMPNAVQKIIDVDKEFNSDVFFWKPHIYIWPDTLENNAMIQNVTKTSQSKNFDPMINVRKSYKLGGSLLRNTPMLYHSAVKKTLLEDIICRNGRLFQSRQPDIFSGIAISIHSKIATNIGTALSVNAWSARSNSGSMRKKYGSKENISYVNEYINYKTHYKLFESTKTSFFNVTPEAMLEVSDCYKEENLELNFNAMWPIFFRLSGFNNYFWLLENWKIVTRNQKINWVELHFFLLLNIFKYFFEKIKATIGLYNKKTKLKNVMEFVNYMENK